MAARQNAYNGRSEFGSLFERGFELCLKGSERVRRERKKRDQRRRQNITLAPRSEGGESILRLAVLSLSSLPRNSVSTTLCTEVLALTDSETVRHSRHKLMLCMNAAMPSTKSEVTKHLPSAALKQICCG
ncbi:hypothetical protein PCH_Pc13g13340 [Penicillium rubens Wisconsin 54-1255]|uniref:Uncharacterized protein n=1 Tax=Penicillium rubens (strain ATCC 28089 / DSM 1075 / NRRL 1951 / Wisconsin 54-1255) TaxID=500485 RepID=B6H3K4_PENRW|nr:hypothetical protein PCH_Pc13g13340 [Penicillium rubens Wisconsin 54-1255]